MQYRKIYKVMEQRWQVSPGFRFVDQSGWRNPKSAAKRCPLLLMMEDQHAMRRIWVIHDGSNFTVSYIVLDPQGRPTGQLNAKSCRSVKEAAHALEQVFARLGQVA